MMLLDHLQRAKRRWCLWVLFFPCLLCIENIAQGNLCREFSLKDYCILPFSISCNCFVMVTMEKLVTIVYIIAGGNL